VRKLEPLRLPSWALPFVVLALIAPAIIAFSLGGPPVGLAIGALTASSLIVLAARARFDEQIEVPPPAADRYMLLAVALIAIDSPALTEPIAEAVRAGAASTGASAREPEVLVLAPAVNSPLAEWLSDLDRARFDAQRRLALSIGGLAAAGVNARGQVGDSDPVQAIEDVLRTYPAREVVFVTGADGAATGALEEVRRRLDRPVRQVVASAGASARAR
jgi:hypothetical protein